MNNKKQIRRQRQRRRAGHIRRVEFLLVDCDRDEEISQYLDSLEPRQRSEFIRQAIYTAMGQEHIPETAPVSQASPQQTGPGESFNAAMAELDAKIRVLQQLAEAIGQQPAPQLPSAPPDAPGAIESSGLDLNPPRRRSTRPSAPVTPQNTLSEPDFDPEASARILLESVRSYGRNHRP